MSQKPGKTTEQEKKKRKRKKKTKQTITRAVTPIRLIEAYLEDLADDAEVKAEAKGTTLDPKRKGPKWREWKIPELHVPCIQANAGAGGGGELRGRDVRLLAQNFHAGQRQASAHPCETLVLPQKSP